MSASSNPTESRISLNLNREEWRAARAQDITSTEVAALFGLSPYCTKYELWHRKKQQEILELEENERMFWGTVLQPAIATGAAKKLGVEIRPMTEYIRIPDLRLGASFDYEIQGEEKGGLEIKNIDWLRFRDDWIVDEETGEIEATPGIELQLQHQMFCSLHKYAYVGALVGGNNLWLQRREADPAIHARIVDESAKFWASIDADEPPPPVFPQDIAVVSRLYGMSSPGKVIPMRDEIRALCLEYDEARALAKEAEERRKSIGAQLLMALGDAEICAEGGIKVTAKPVAETWVEAFQRKGSRPVRVTVKEK